LNDVWSKPEMGAAPLDGYPAALAGDAGRKRVLRIESRTVSHLGRAHFRVLDRRAVAGKTLGGRSAGARGEAHGGGWGQRGRFCDRRGNTLPSTPRVGGASDEHRYRCGSPTSSRAGRRRSHMRKQKAPPKRGFRLMPKPARLSNPSHHHPAAWQAPLPSSAAPPPSHRW
jgi:hypothetical protein